MRFGVPPLGGFLSFSVQSPDRLKAELENRPKTGKALAVWPGVYLEFYGLREAPFSITPNRQLTGQVGAGKTTLCRAMLDQPGKNFCTPFSLASRAIHQLEGEIML